MAAKFIECMPPPTLRLPVGGYLAAAIGDLGLLDRIDHRHDDAPGPGVEHALDVVVRPFGHAGQRHAAGVGDGGEDRRRLRPVDGRMLDVERQPVEAHAGQHARGVQIAQREPGAERRLRRGGAFL